MTQPVEYMLSEKERGALHGLNQQVLAGKAVVYDANLQLENMQAQARQALMVLRDAEQRWSGGLAALAAAHDMEGAHIAPDLSRFTRPAEPAPQPGG